MNQINCVDFCGTDKMNSLLNISNDSSELVELKEQVSSVFQVVGSFLLDTSREMDAFHKLITPYVEYFYVNANGEGEHDSFITDVVKPSQQEMNRAINQAVSIMQNDSSVNTTVETSIKKALEIKPMVEKLLEMIEEIETYSWNAMLISTKAGLHGQALATISGQVSTLSGTANETAKNCKQILENLNNQYDEFEKICQRIDIINENYLTSMSVKSGMIFKEMVNELEKLSSSVNDIMGFAFTIQSIIGSLMGQIQREDLVRQDLEKAICLMEIHDLKKKQDEMASILFDFDDVDAIEELIASLLKRKYNSVYSNLQTLIDGTEDCCSKIKELINAFLKRFYNRGDAQWAEYYEGRKFDIICEKLEKMKEEFVLYIEEIIKNKKRLYDLSKNIVHSIATFRTLFDEMVKISRRFEIINMLTKIELAKHADLRKSIGGSLVHVSNLPAEMKKMVESAIHHHGVVMGAIEKALDDYYSNYITEEKVLAQCIETMKKISVKLFESQKYYRDISEKIGSTGMSILAFLETRTEECAHGREMIETIYRYLALVEEIGLREIEELMENRKLEAHVKHAYDAIEEMNGCHDSNSMVLKSLLLEAFNTSGEKRVMLF